jgi:hypothetical protein
VPSDFGSPPRSTCVCNVAQIRVLLRGGKGGFRILVVDLEMPCATTKPGVGTPLLHAPTDEKGHEAGILRCAKVSMEYSTTQSRMGPQVKQRSLRVFQAR